MGEIYTKAQRTIIWLGNDSEDNDGRVAFAFFSEAARRIWYRQRLDRLASEMRFLKVGVVKVFNPSKAGKPRSPYALTEFWNVEKQHGHKSVEVAELEKMLKGLNIQHMQHATRLLLQRGWFGRRWIIQEACLAQKAIMVCGAHTLKWTAFERVVSSTRTSPFWQGDQQQAHDLLRTWKYLRWQWRDNKGKILSLQYAARQLFWHLRTLDRFECQDARDTIGALLGLWNPLSDHVTMDYSRSIEDNYCLFARKMITSGLLVDVLYSATQRPRSLENNTTLLPSVSLSELHTADDNLATKRAKCHARRSIC